MVQPLTGNSRKEKQIRPGRGLLGAEVKQKSGQDRIEETMTTLIEGGSHMCQVSGPASMSDGVMTPRKKTSEIWLNVERYWHGNL